MVQLFEDFPVKAQSETSKSGFAALLGISPARVSQLIAQGLPTEQSGRINIAAGRAWYEANTSPDRRKSKPSGHLSAADELKQIRVEQARLDLDRAKGALVDRQAAEDAIFTRARAERDAHLTWAARIAPMIAQRLAIDPSRLFAELDRELRAHLAKLADAPIQDLPRDE